MANTARRGNAAHAPASALDGAGPSGPAPLSFVRLSASGLERRRTTLLEPTPIDRPGPKARELGQDVPRIPDPTDVAERERAQHQPLIHEHAAVLQGVERVELIEGRMSIAIAQLRLGSLQTPEHLGQLERHARRRCARFAGSPRRLARA
jgi:hypothetical protein